MEKTLNRNIMEENRQQQNNKKTSEGEETKIYLTPDSSLQTQEEDRFDKSTDQAKNDSLSVSREPETTADRYAGSDRAGTAERKDNQPRTE
jgi:hypothetical protein